MKIGSKLMATAVIMAGVSMPGLARAVSENLPWSDPVADTSIGTGSACSVSGLKWEDEVNYGVDSSGLMKVDGNVVGAGATTVDSQVVGSDTSLSYSETIGDFLVQIDYRVTPDNVVRTLVTITNNGTSDLVDVPVSMLSNFGDDFAIEYVDGGVWRNSGDWFVTSEEPGISSPAGYYAEVFHAVDGPGSPESVAAMTDCAGSAWDMSTPHAEEMMFSYLVDIPVGQSRRILTVQGYTMSGATHADGIAANIAKGTSLGLKSLSPGSGILSDLTDEDACTVVNWDFSVCSGGGGSPSYDFDDIDIENYMRPESDLPDTK